MDDYPRDLEGYRGRPPHAGWPGGARVAVNFVVNIEEGAERCVLFGDASSENFLLEIPGREAIAGGRDLFSESVFDYGARAGVWRLLRLFERWQVSVTAWACGRALEQNPAVAGYLVDHGHEIAGHGYRWIDYAGVPAAIEARDIEKTIDIIRGFSGEPPLGWYTGRRSLNTRRLLVEAGIRYDSESYGDDLPYWVRVGDRPHLVIPYSFDTNDAKYFMTPGWMSGDDFLCYLKNSFDCLYREGEQLPSMMTVALHCRISGRPGRAQIIHRFLEYIHGISGVWIATRKQIAQHWFEYHPYREQGANNE